MRQFSTIARGEFGSSEDVEITGVAVHGGEEPCFGLTIRTLERRAGRERLGGGPNCRARSSISRNSSVAAPKNLVRETTDLIERLCIEAALEMTGDNRASAAEMLG